MSTGEQNPMQGVNTGKYERNIHLHICWILVFYLKLISCFKESCDDILLGGGSQVPRTQNRTEIFRARLLV